MICSRARLGVVFPAQRPWAAHLSADRLGILAIGGGMMIFLGLPGVVMAGEPSPILIDPLDPRAEGEGPGLVGDPLLALGFVIVLGLLAAGAAALFVRLTQRR
jgi:hypothetical protein